MPRAENTRRLTFPKEKRLTHTTEFARVQSEGTKHHGRILMLGVLAPKDEKSFRTGFVTSKRVGKAVVRNRLRRRLREIVRTEQQRLRAGFWCVVIARPAAAQASYRALRDEWLHLAERASILAP